ncbi:MAG: DNA adenine methylase [Bacteroidia bacterium]|nr:DNA adenine methylase [Bacteroidia bacterium]
MKYMGSKNRIAKDILPIILNGKDEYNCYVEPFVGGCNVIDKVDMKNRIGADNNEYLIEMFNNLQSGVIDFPDSISKDLYDRARTYFNNGLSNEMSVAMIGWIGFMASYNGKFFDGGYNGNYKKRDYVAESIKNIRKQISDLKDVKFICSSYQTLEIPEKSIIYCDPPYQGTTQYNSSKNFNHTAFWEWCRDMSKQGHQVFISEYNAPKDFECVWQKEMTTTINHCGTLKPIEKLYRFKKQKIGE